jgi:signal transduction histidine kinase
MRKFIGLRTEIVLNITVLMIAATALIGFVVLKVSEQAALDQKVKSATVILNSIQSSLKYAELYTYSADAEGVQRLIDIFIENSGIEAILVVDRDMRIIAHSSRGEVGKPHSDEALLRGVREKRVTTDTRGGSVSISSPLYLRDEVFGGVKVVLSGSDVREAAAKSQRLIIFYIILDSAILVVFGSILLSRTIVRPIDELVKVTEAVADGNLNQRIMVKRLNEVGMLSESFNRMTERLREGKEALEANIKSLEAAHEELKRAQDEVIGAEKMATVGRLAAGIAHEIGNPLGAILGYVDILQKGIGSGDEAEYLRRIETEIQRINRIVRGLLDYARPGEFKVEEADVNDVIMSSLDLVSAQKGFERIEIRKDLGEVPRVNADTHQLQQVLINLFINASDVMPEGGHLTVESRVRKGTVESGLSLKKSGDWVEILVTDTGSGMSEDEVKRIFDPFYTTKEPGKGTGLGLAICQRIIESFGGGIEVESRKGKGSTFKILLPLGKMKE